MSGKQRIRICGVLLAGALALTSCATVQKVIPTEAWHRARVRNEGYSLLYHLLSQESDAAKILIIKKTDSPISDLVKEISGVSGQAKNDLEQFQQKDRHLSFETANLPEVEVKARAAIQSTETKQLLFSSGETFEVRFLSTQAEAMNYAAHLAQVLRDQEDNPARKEFLETLSTRCTALHDRVMKLLKY